MGTPTLMVREASGEYRKASSGEIWDAAKKHMRRRFARGRKLEHPNDVRDHLAAQLGFEENEIFAALYLDNRHRIIGYVEHFHGTIDGCSVYVRAIVQHALKVNAAAVVLAHQHPSGNPDPSEADKRITRRLQDALALVDTRVLDHFVIGGTDVLSFAERGLL